MASSDNLAAMDPWLNRLAAFPDSWISEAYAHDTDALTQALQMSFSNTGAPIAGNFGLLDVASSTSNISGSDPDTPLRRGRAPSVAAGKVAKRKSRASKRSQTTFIAADPANFRQMVQQVTGVGFEAPRASGLVPVLKPEPLKVYSSSGIHGAVSCLPTLDTSAFLLDQVGGLVSTAPEATPEPVTGSDDSFDYDAFSCFPTLESFRRF